MEQITDINQLDPNGVYTYADYWKWKFEEYVELFRGKLMRMSPAPLREHQWIAGNIFRQISIHLRRKPCKVYGAPFDVRLPKGKDELSDKEIYTVVQPDVCIICDPQKLDVRGCIGAPDTVIEILSRKNVDRDVKQKFALYEEHGVPEYWIVAPGVKNVTVYLLSKETGKYELRGDYGEEGIIPLSSLPGFGIEWEEIFEE